MEFRERRADGRPVLRGLTRVKNGRLNEEVARAGRSLISIERPEEKTERLRRVFNVRPGALWYELVKPD